MRNYAAIGVLVFLLCVFLSFTTTFIPRPKHNSLTVAPINVQKYKQHTPRETLKSMISRSVLGDFDIPFTTMDNSNLNLGKGNVCFALSEVDCEGDSLLSQAESLHESGRNVLVLDFSENESDSQQFLSQQCTRIRLPTVFCGRTPSVWKGLKVSMKAAALLYWMKANPHVCKTLHISDRNGLGVFITQARRANMPEFRDLHVHVQAHGTHLLETREMKFVDVISDAFIVAQERLSIELADSVSFLGPSMEQVYKKWYNLPATRFVSTGAVETSAHILQTVKVFPTHLIFYGELNFQTGLTLFLEGVRKCTDTHSTVESISIVGRGPSSLSKSELDSLFAPLKGKSRHFNLYDKADDSELHSLFTDSLPNALVVIPSLVEFSNKRLIEIVESKIPFIASGIWAHRELLPQSESLLFEPNPESLSLSLSEILNYGFTWQPLTIDRHLPASTKLQDRIDQHISKKPSSEEDSSLLPEVTVGVIVCNRLQYLQTAVDSIDGQDYPSTKLSIVLIAGCSKSLSCNQLLLAVTTKLGSINCYELETDYGNLGAARNLAAEEARTDLVLFIDDDDVFVPEAVGALTRAAIANPSMGIFASWVLAFEGDPYNPNLLGQWIAIGPAMEILPYANSFGGSQVLLRKSSEFWRSGVRYSADVWAGCEDWELHAHAVLQKQHILVPIVSMLYRKVAGTGMLAWNHNHPLQARCANRVFEAIALELKHPSLYSAFSFAHSLYKADTKHPKW